MTDEARAIRDHVVSALPQLVPPAARTERVRTLCSTRLERDRHRSARVAAITRFGRHIVAPAIVAGLFASYAADLLSITLRTFTT
jgi:hypothetical protein